MRFRPCIDLHQGRVKQIVGATLRDDEARTPTVHHVSGKTAGEFARMYREDGLSGGHVIMLGPGNEQAALDALSAYRGGLQVGGGIRPDNASLYLQAGASHVIVTSYVFHDGVIDWDRLRALVDVVGRERLVLDLSCKCRDDRYLVATDRWQRLTDTSVDAESLSALAQCCNEFLVHAADVEGLQQGPDLVLARLLAEHSPISCTYAGGIRDITDLDALNEVTDGRVDVTVGSALDIFGGDLPYRDVVRWHRRHNS